MVLNDEETSGSGSTLPYRPSFNSVSNPKVCGTPENIIHNDIYYQVIII